jgi:hypothetical protein
MHRKDAVVIIFIRGGIDPIQGAAEVPQPETVFPICKFAGAECAHLDLFLSSYD